MLQTWGWPAASSYEWLVTNLQIQLKNKKENYKLDSCFLVSHDDEFYLVWKLIHTIFLPLNTINFRLN